MEKIMNFWNSLSTKGKIAVAIVAFCVAGPFGLIAIALSHWSINRTRFGNTNFRYNFVKMLGNMLNIPCAFSSFYHKICYF